MFIKTILSLTLFVSLLLTGCSDNATGVVDAEPALAVLGGAIMGTQGTGVVAMEKVRKPNPLNDFLNALNPIQEAFARRNATACTDMTTATDKVCGGTGGNELMFSLQNCQPSGVTRSGLWRSYIKYTFPTAFECGKALASGFDAVATIPFLSGKTITRSWGQGQAGDENNIRVGADGTVNFFYGTFPSGWQEDRVGGVDITFTGANQRRIVINGVHALGLSYASEVVPNPASFDLTTLSVTGSDVTRKADHTIHTVKIGDPLFEVGPALSFDGTTSRFGTIQSNTEADFDGDIIVNTDTVAVGATMRIQHNMSQSIAVLTVTEELVYSDPNCCWPVTGKVEVEYDRNLKSPTLRETIVFLADACGSIDYTTTLLANQSRTLSQCF